MNNRRIAEYEFIGRLTWPGDSARPSRETLTRQLRTAEARVSNLAAQLAEAETEVKQLRGKL